VSFLQPNIFKSVTEDNTKPVWASKTYHFNIGVNVLVASAVELHPSFGPWLSSHPQTMILAITVGNIVLRHFTKSTLNLGGEK
jgi:hypothetical protein